jgi:hypothetical protein
MSFIYSRALGEAFSQANCSGTDASALSSGSHMPKPCLWHDKTMEPSRLSRFGMMCRPLTEGRGEELLTGFRAKTYPQQAKVQESTESEAECGGIWPASLAKYDPATSSWKTAQYSLLGGLDEFLETWPRWGLMLDGECWERQTLAPRTNESVSGLWQTPVADDTSSRRTKYAQGGTPLSLAVRLWPTPTAGNHKSGGYLAEWGGSAARKVMAELVPQEEMFGPLNPDWVEWLMGWPIGWTDLKPLETAKFQEWRRQHSIF